MKTKKGRLKKVIAAVVAFLLIGFILITVNQFVGNPVSKMLANRAAQKYVDEKYSDLNLELEKAFYNFKDGRYSVRAKSNKSIDTHFDINFTPYGKLNYDSYEGEVLNKYNTWTRIDQEYRDLTDTVFKDNFPYKSDIDYGQLLDKGEGFSYLELDKKYDIKEMAKKEGKITFYTESEIRDKKTMTEILFNIKRKFDEKDVPFYSIDLTLEKPRDEEGKYDSDLMIMDFLYEDIYKEGLEERVEKNIKETRKYYEEQDREIREEKQKHEKDIKYKDKN